MDDLIERLRNESTWHVGSPAKDDTAGLLREAAAALEATREDAWQPIETAPTDGSDILTLFDCATVPVVHSAWFRSKDEWQRSGQFAASEDETIDDYVGWWSYTRNSVTQERLVGWSAPTHWMPLPAPPKEARNG